ncbi:MAG: 5'/3'-nucleotidase SurE [Leptospiraceae bacterium]|nr:5'/3'-nucleotidase SurE [Leptospiraceae bacterium]
MNILITNDDGISSNGIKALEKIFKPKFKTYLIAPLKERSATSQALSIFDRLRVEKISEDHYIVDGYPVDCVNIGLHGNIFPPIDIVISGINRGVNMGHDVHYSGTVGAARHGAIHNKLSFAISSGNLDINYNYESEAKAILEIIENHLSTFQKGIVYNINIPLNFKNISEMKITNLGIRTYADTYEVNNIYENISEFYLGGSELGKKITQGSDFEAFEKEFISLTPIGLETTDFKELEKLKKEFL